MKFFVGNVLSKGGHVENYYNYFGNCKCINNFRYDYFLMEWHAPQENWIGFHQGFTGPYNFHLQKIYNIQYLILKQLRGIAKKVFSFTNKKKTYFIEYKSAKILQLLFPCNYFSDTVIYSIFLYHSKQCFNDLYL